MTISLTSETALKKEPSGLRFPRPVKEAALAALLALLLAIPFIGLRTNDGGTGATLGLETHPERVIIAVVAVFLGHLLFGAGRALLTHVDVKPERLLIGSLASKVPLSKIFVAVGIVFAIALPFLPFANRYWIDVATTVLIYVMLGWGLNIVVGLAGLLDLGYAAFYAIGAYTFALLSSSFGLSFWECLPLAGVAAAMAGILLGIPVLRLRGDYLAIVTLGFGEIIRLILLNWTEVTGGPDGISSIPRPTFFGIPFARSASEGTLSFHSLFGIEFSTEHRLIFIYFIILALALLTNAFTLRMRRLPVGRAWEALREDEIAAQSLGLNPTNIKLSAFAIGAMFGGLAGSFFATKQGFVSPESFTFLESAIILAIVVLGGMGSQVGVVLAAAILVLLPELGRQFVDYRMLIFGLAMVAIMVWRPRGLLAHRSPTIHLRDKPLAKVTESFPSVVRNSVVKHQPLLAVEHMTLRFGGLTAVDDVAFTAYQGEITAIIGPNGAGKTSVFNCLTGFYQPSRGRITMHSPGGPFLLERMESHRIAAEAGLARTFQHIRLFPAMSVLENLIIAQHAPLMRASGFSVLGLVGWTGYRRAESESVERARYWLDRVGLTARADHEAGSLPYGDQRRLEIARALCTQPQLLCLDEPAAGLNPHESARLNDLLLSIRDEQGVGIILIEHDMSVVMRISDHVIVLDYGRKIADGSPAKVQNDPIVIKAYLGEQDELPEVVRKDLGAAIASTQRGGAIDD